MDQADSLVSARAQSPEPIGRVGWTRRVQDEWPGEMVDRFLDPFLLTQVVRRMSDPIRWLWSKSHGVDLVDGSWLSEQVVERLKRVWSERRRQKHGDEWPRATLLQQFTA